MSSSTDAPGRGRTVLYVLHGEEVGGASLSALRVIPKLRDLGWKPLVWAPAASDLYEEIRARGLEVHGEPRAFSGYSLEAMRIPPGALARLRRAPGYFRRLRRLIRDRKPALVHCNSMYTLAEAGVARSCGVPVVMHVHEMVGETAKHRLAKRLIAAVGNEVVGVSAAGANALSAGGSQTRIVHEACEVPTEMPARPGGARTVVGSIGVISTRKGSDLFVEAAELVGEETGSVAFELVGAPTDPLESDWAAEVVARARRTGIEYRESADVPEALASWDIFALPSRKDPFPIVVLEAMASGLPVIGSRVDGIAEQLEGGTGILIEPNDPGALARAILELDRDPDRRRRLGSAGRARVLEHFSLDRQAQGLSEAYLSALGETL